MGPWLDDDHQGRNGDRIGGRRPPALPRGGEGGGRGDPGLCLGGRRVLGRGGARHGGARGARPGPGRRQHAADGRVRAAASAPPRPSRDPRRADLRPAPRRAAPSGRLGGPSRLPEGEPPPRLAARALAAAPGRLRRSEVGWARRRAELTNRKLIALAVLGSALCAISAVVATTDPVAPGRTFDTTVAVLTVAALLGVGLYAWYREGEGRFGQVLFATGICWFFVTLSNSDVSLLYSVGRIAGWVFEVVLAYALLSYPIGRLENRGARAVVIAGALLIGL